MVVPVSITVAALILLLAAPAPVVAQPREGASGVLGASKAVPLGGELREIAARPGVTQRFILVKPAGDPVASVILFAGGHGRLALSDAGITELAGNFLVRNRARFAAEGFLVAVLDAPSDHPGGLGAFRASEDHARDVALEKITIPTLVVHHREDGCSATQYIDVPRMMSRLKNPPKRELLTFEGGDRPRSDPCEAFSHHGSIGLDAQVVTAIARWIKDTPAR